MRESQGMTCYQHVIRIYSYIKFLFLYRSLCIIRIRPIAQSAGAVEYTDCFSAEG